MTSRKNRKHDELLEDIVFACYHFRPSTRREICERLGMKKDAHVVYAIRELVKEGLLMEVEASTIRGNLMFLYYRVS